MQSVCKRYKLKNASRCVDLGEIFTVIFVLQLTRLNWSREVVGILVGVRPISVSRY